MDLPDCPPGAEGYEDSVTEVAKKPDITDNTCTKAEQEFQEHLNSLKVKTEDGNYRCMVERRGRDVSGKWIYLCFPCAATCSGESVLQTHISGKKHKTKMSLKSVWPLQIFEDHRFIMQEKGITLKGEATDKVLQKMAQEVHLHNKDASEFDAEFMKNRLVRCHIQDSLDDIKVPLLGVEYLIEFPPEQEHYEPSYLCTLCSKQGHPRTIINHLTCFWHRYNYLIRHFNKASTLLTPFRAQPRYREAVSIIMHRLATRIEDKYGRMRPVHFDKEEYDKDKERINQWIFKGKHISETEDCTFEEVVDVDLINTLHKPETQKLPPTKRFPKDPSPPVVSAPSRPKKFQVGKQHIRPRTTDSLSDISDEPDVRAPRDQHEPIRFNPKNRFAPYPEKRRESPVHSRRSPAKVTRNPARKSQEKRPPNYAYKVKLAEERQQVAEDCAKKALAYHEKNPEKHPLYPEEWKKFWNRRYKEIQAEGKDPSKHDFKPEWIVFWTARMKELHDEELQVNVTEIYRKMCLTPPSERAEQDARGKRDAGSRDARDRDARVERDRRIDRDVRSDRDFRDRELRADRDIRGDRERSPRRRSPPRRRTPLHRSSPPRRPSPPRHVASPERRPRRSPERRSPVRRSPGRRSPIHRSPGRRSPVRGSPGRRSPMRRSPVRRSSVHRSPVRRSPVRQRSPVRRRTPLRHLRTRSRSPIYTERPLSPRPGASVPVVWERHRSRSPLSRRDPPPRNLSPAPHPRRASPARPLAPSPSLQTVLISDDELKPDDGLSPWNSDDSLGSLPDARSPLPPPPRSRSRTGSVASRVSRRTDRTDRAHPRVGPPQAHDYAAEDVVATLRLLVALEDYLGSLGPKIIDLLAEAIRMEKEKANSSEELLERESAVVLIETAKEKLKGAAQAGLVSSGAVGAVRSAVVRAAATLHEADTRLARVKKQKAQADSSAKAMPVAGVGAVDREQIARQMAAALVAQGKTDVSAEELAQLVDAVVGIAEAKKREAQSKKEAEVTITEKIKQKLPVATGTASALQMLQTAYDDKKIEKDDAPDAMDGLSDSDLETLLKNFSELSAEEQHSLIAYLKKLEAREPQRVEKLRQYVSAAACEAPAPQAAHAAQPSPPAPPARPALPSKPSQPNKTIDIAPVTIESDDDDYTVEDVFKSATQKVKEDQMRQEMEIVKKSLEETKTVTAATEAPKTVTAANTPLNNSSATDLFALVQASLLSASATSKQQADVVASNTQPRSFGDLPEVPLNITPKPLLNILLQIPNQQTPLRPPQTSYGEDWNNQNDSHDSTPWQPRQLPDDRETLHTQDQHNQEPREPQDTYDQGLTQNNFNQGPRGIQDNYNQSQMGTQANYNQGPRGLVNNYNPRQSGPQDIGMRSNNNNLHNQGPGSNVTISTQNSYENHPVADKQQFSNQQSFNQQYDSQPIDNQQYDNQSIDNQQYDNQPDDNQQYDNQQYDNQPIDNQQYDNQQYNNQQYDNQKFGNQHYNNQQYDNQKMGNQHQFGGQQQFGKQQPMGSNPQYRNPPAFGNKQPFGNPRPYGNQPLGNRPPFGNQQQYGNQPQYGNKQPFANSQQFGNKQNFNNQQFGNPDQSNFRGRGRGQFGGPGRGRGRGYY